MLLGVCVGLFPGKLGLIQLVSFSPRRKRGGGGVLKLNIWISQAVMCRSHTSPGCVLLGEKLLRPKRGSDKKHQTINALTPCVRPHHKTLSHWDHAEITEEVPWYCLPVCFLLGLVITANCNLRHQSPKSRPPRSLSATLLAEQGQVHQSEAHYAHWDSFFSFAWVNMLYFSPQRCLKKSFICFLIAH